MKKKIHAVDKPDEHSRCGLRHSRTYDYENETLTFVYKEQMCWESWGVGVAAQCPFFFVFFPYTERLGEQRERQKGTE